MATFRDIFASFRGGFRGVSSIEYNASFRYQFARLRVDARKCERRQGKISELSYYLNEHLKHPVNPGGLEHYFKTFMIEYKKQVNSLSDLAERIIRINALLQSDIFDKLEISLKYAKPDTEHHLQIVTSMQAEFKKKHAGYSLAVQGLKRLQLGEAKHSALANLKAWNPTSDVKLEREIRLLANDGYASMKHVEWLAESVAASLRANKYEHAKSELEKAFRQIEGLFRTLTILSGHKHTLIEHNYDILEKLEVAVAESSLRTRYPDVGEKLHKELREGVSEMRRVVQKKLQMLFVQADELERKAA